MLSFKVELATVSRALISPQRLYEQVQCTLLAFFFVWYHDVTVRARSSQRQATIPCIGATLTTVKKRLLATKVMRHCDRGLRCTDKDPSEETEDRALISAIKFVYQDYNNRASDDEPATATC